MNDPQPLSARLARVWIALAYPVLLVILAVRLVMTPAFLHFEYTRPGFPVDIYGFTVEDRLRYAPYALDYLIYALPVSYLGDLRFPDGTALYNARELHHMRDVQTVTQWAFLIGIIGGVITVGAAAYLLRRQPAVLREALRAGALLTLGIIFTIVIIAALSWDVFFTAFHSVFFAEGTWMFLYSDTLIRLFPEQFWFDAVLVIGAIAISIPLLTFLLTFARPPSRRLT